MRLESAIATHAACLALLLPGVTLANVTSQARAVPFSVAAGSVRGVVAPGVVGAGVFGAGVAGAGLVVPVASLGPVVSPAQMGAAPAEPTAAEIKQAAQAFDRGREAFRAENYVEAAEYFESADGFAPRADTLRLAMLARQAAGQMDRALTLAALALEVYGTDEEAQKAATEVMAEGASSHAKVSVSCDEPCQLLLDDKLVHGRAATQRTLYVQPGTHTVRASWGEGRVESDEFAVVVGDDKSVDFVAPPVPESNPTVTPTSSDEAPREEAKEDKGGWSPVVFWTGVGLTAAGVGVSTYLGLRAINEPGTEAVETGCARGDTDCALLQQGYQNQTMATVAIGATAAVGVFTIITGLWLTDFDGKGSSPESADGGQDGGDDTGGEDAGWSRAGRERREEPRGFLEVRSGSFRMQPFVTAGDGFFLGTFGKF